MCFGYLMRSRIMYTTCRVYNTNVVCVGMCVMVYMLYVSKSVCCMLNCVTYALVGASCMTCYVGCVACDVRCGMYIDCRDVKVCACGDDGGGGVRVYCVMVCNVLYIACSMDCIICGMLHVVVAARGDMW